MAEQGRVEQLLDEIFDTDRTPEEICADCPELLPEVRRRWQKMCVLQAEIEALFPPGDNTACDSSAPWRPGADLPQIPGHEVEAVLGHGGVGVVYKARDLRLGRPVALKMLLAGAYAGPADRTRFLREAEAVASLRHPNIVQVHGAGEHDGRLYFTMEYIEGGSLHQRVAGAPQPARQAAALVATIAEAVHVAHQRGIVHRDLKPANILMTEDGTPKLSDFGLARRLEGGAGLTQTGVPMGTPSYMSPEQARGETRGIGPAADTYALGALLYELLTGRPPFRAETSAETLRQVISEIPVPPSRLNAAVPRDAETICLKCLEKEPRRRYASAAALTEDLRRFGEGRPIQARPVGRGERLWRWGRRNPTAAALLAMAVALVGLAGGGGLWLLQQRAVRAAELRSDVGTAVTQATSRRKGFHFSEARDLLEQVQQRLEPAGPGDLRGQVSRARADLDVAERLDTARVRAATLVGAKLDPAGAEPLYEAAFVDAGLARQGDEVRAAARVRESAVSTEIVAALDDWASITQDVRRQAWLLAVARGADPDPARDRLRQPDLWQDGARLTQLTRELSVAELTPELATALGRIARARGGEAITLLTRAQARSPQDFRLNFELAWALLQAGRYDEALGHFRVALALRPEASAAYNGLGAALSFMGRTDEAIACLQEALRFDSNYDVAHYNLAGAYRVKGRLDEAIAQYQQALSIDPRYGAAHVNLGLALAAKGRRDEAIAHYEQALHLGSKYTAQAHSNIGAALRDMGRPEEAIAQFQQALSIDPTLTVPQLGLCLTLYDAACAAVGAASQDAENVRHGQLERAGVRRQALARLRAGLELAAKLLNDGKLAESWLASWQTNPALASVRDPKALAKLPNAEREPWQRLWADLAALLAADPLAQGRARAARRDWEQAAGGYARALARGPTDDGFIWFEYAALALLSGDRPGYARACAVMVEGRRKAGGPRAYHVARAYTLAPHAVADASFPGRLVEEELLASPQEFWSLTEQGALAYRAGRFQEAIPLFQQSLRADSTPGRAVLNWLWLALAQERFGKHEEARRWLGRATAWLDQYADGMPARAEEQFGLHLHNWLEAHVLRREAEAALGPKKSS